MNKLDLSKYLGVYSGFFLTTREQHFNFTNDLAEVEIEEHFNFKKDLAEVEEDLKDLLIRYYYLESCSKKYS